MRQDFSSIQGNSSFQRTQSAPNWEDPVPKSSTYIAKIPDDTGHIAYTAEENAVWADLYAQQVPRMPQRPILMGLLVSPCPRTVCRNARKFQTGCAP